MQSTSSQGKLTEDELANPHLILHDFFSYYTPDSAKENLWEWLKTTVSGTFNSNMLNKGSRYELLCLYEHLEKLIEASYIIHSQQESKRPERTKRSACTNEKAE